MSNFKLGVLSASFKCGFEDTLKKVKSLGLDGIQLDVVSGENDFRAFDSERLKVFNGLMDKYDIQVSALCGDLGGHGIMEREEIKYGRICCRGGLDARPCGLFSQERSVLYDRQ